MVVFSLFRFCTEFIIELEVAVFIVLHTTNGLDKGFGYVRVSFILSVRKLRSKCSVAMVYW